MRLFGSRKARPFAGALVLVWLLLMATGALAQPDEEAAPLPAGPAAQVESESGPTGAPAKIDLRTIQEGAGDTTILQRLVSLVGLLVMLGIGWALSSGRRRVPWRIVIWGVGLQMAFGFFVMKTSVGRGLFEFLDGVVMRLLSFTTVGSKFLFGNYLDQEFTFALNVLPTIIFFSSLMTVLYHLGVMQVAVKAVAWLMQRTMRTSGSESLSAAANIFVGQTEAPLVVKPFIETMTQSELMAIMTGGFATVAGGVMAAYVDMLSGTFEGIAGHLIAASVMSAPAALVIAKVMIPETQESATAGGLEMTMEKTDANLVDAAARGAGEGLSLALNVGAMLLAFLALVAMLNYLLGYPAELLNRGIWADLAETLAAGGHSVPPGCESPEGFETIRDCVRAGLAQGGLAAGDFDLWVPLSMERILGWVFWPLAWIMGVPAADCTVVAQLLGEKMVLNEFVAYAHLGEILSGPTPISPRAAVISVYALCGFANFGSIAIQIGGIGGIAPNRRHDLARIGLRAMIGGTLAAFMTATVAGILI